MEDTLLGCWFSHSNPDKISDSLAEDSSILITEYSEDIRLLFSEVVDFF